MNILLLCEVFPPQIGGIERMAEMLTSTLNTLGHSVRILTLCAAPARRDDWPANITVHSCPGLLAHWSALRWADIVICNHLSLRTAWPELLLHHRVIIWCHTYLPQTGIGGKFKTWAMRRHTTFAVSSHLAATLPQPSGILENCYAPDIYHSQGRTSSPDIDFLFVGRLMRGKQPHLILEGAAELIAQGQPVRAVIIGDGPEKPRLAEQILKNGMSQFVILAGSLPPHSVAQYMRNSRYLLIPSDWGESFGLVAIEGIACGCEIIGTDDGGLPEAIGDCGQTVSAKDPAAFKQKMKEALLGQLTTKTNLAQRHLERFTPSTFAESWSVALAKVMT